MKHIFILFCFCFLASIQLNSQFCSHVADHNDVQRLLRNKKTVAEGKLVKTGAPIYVPVTFHIVNDSNGEGGVSEVKIAEQLCRLNKDYESVGMVFYIKDKKFNYINNTSLFENPTSSQSGTKMALEKSSAGKNSVNIFITKSADTGGLGSTLGYYDPNLDLIVMKKDQVNGLTGTLPHEMGHFFSLMHVFNGWDQEAWSAEEFGNPVNSQYSPGGVLNELADGSNCDIAGDFLCDTPADYNLGFSWSGCSTYDGGCKDFNGQLLKPQENNYMSYFIGCSQYVFSEEQIDMILADYNSPARNFLKVGYTPNTEDVKDIEIISPQDDEEFATFNDIVLEWEEDENAIFYVVSLKRLFNEQFFLTTDNSIEFDDLEHGKKYSWKVAPISEIGGCAGYSELRDFKTGTVSNTFEQEFQEITIKSNLIADNLIRIEAQSSQKINYSLIDISGNVLISESRTIYPGSSYIEIGNDYARGMYVLRLTNETGHSKTFKLIFNN